MNKYYVVLLCIIILSISCIECKGGRGGGGRGGGRGGSRGSRGKGSSKGGKSGGIGLRRSSSTAGLTGSALGFHLGHKIGHMNSVHNGGHSHGGGVHIYSVSHYYHKEDRPLVRNSNVDVNNLVPCNNITFCPFNSHPLCLPNGTIYCVTPMSTVFDCIVNFTTLQCVNTTLFAPCLGKHDSTCNKSTGIRNQTAQIPCITNLFVFGNLDGKSSQRSAASIQMDRRNLEEYCVMVIADPLMDYEEDDEIIGYIVGPALLILLLGALIYHHHLNKKKTDGSSNEIRL